MPDGARHAMLGYLYQFFQIASLRAYAAGDLPVGSNWRTFVGLIAGGRLMSEMFGQDGMAAVPGDAGKEWVALQVKYSGDPDKKINLQFLLELLNGFDRSRALASDDGISLVRYYVLTNLQPDSSVARLWLVRTRDALALAVAGRRGRNGRPDWLAKLIENYGDETTAVDRWSAILSRLEPILNASFEFGLDGLRAFARRHGALEPETNRNLETLAGRLMSDAAGGAPVEITEPWLKEMLVGAGDARNVSFDAADGMLAAARTRLTNRLQRVADAAPGLLARRRYSDQLLAEVQRHNVTFIAGGGGSGKSVLAIEHLLSYVNGPLGLSLVANDTNLESIPVFLRDLRSQAEANRLPGDTLAQAVQRLKAANPDQGVLLAIDIDALDEAHPQTWWQIRQVIRLFADHGDGLLSGKLIVSCRPGQHGPRGAQGLVREWLDAPSHDRVGVVEVGDFDEQELQEAERLLGDPPGDRLSRTAGFETLEGAEGPEDHPSAERRELVRSLQHPVVWGAYRGLSPDQRRSVRGGDPMGTDPLAAALLERFLRKCLVRRNLVVPDHHLELALRRVATSTIATTPPFALQGVWQAACGEVLGIADSKSLFVEALTYGLIEDGVRSTWLWRHGFLERFLARGGT